MKTHTINASDGYPLTVYTYPSSQQTKGMVLIVHGLGEYGRRYEAFADKLTQSGYHVVSFDQRGHGKSNQDNPSIHFKSRKGNRALYLDTKMMIDYAKTIDPSLPCFVFAHSMGSFVVRQCLHEDPFIVDGVVLSGSPLLNKLNLSLGLLIALFIRLVKGNKHCSRWFTKTFADAPYKSMRKRGMIQKRHEWTTADKAMQQAYLDDPLTQKPLTIQAHIDLMRLMRKAQPSRKRSKTSIPTPIALYTGRDDALCLYGKATIQLQTFLIKHHFNHVDLFLIEHTRHELLNETNRDETSKHMIHTINRMQPQ